MSRGIIIIIIISVLYRSQATLHSITTTVVRLGHSTDVSIMCICRIISGARSLSKIFRRG